MVQISHELTPQLFNFFDKHNDYDFILPRFWKNNSQYKEWYSKSKKFKILDNGLFEGDSFTDQELIEIINEVQPDIFVSPDTWNDSNNTYKKAKYWYNVLKPNLPSKTKLMVVMQGEKVIEFEILYENCVDLGYKHFAFNHSSRAYQKMFNYPNELVNQMFGRIKIITHLRNCNFIQDNHYIHLLGCSIVNEFPYYSDNFYNFINSIDTSNPIILGALGYRYKMATVANFTKPKEKIEDFYDKDLDSKIDFISYNIDRFKNFFINEYK